VRILSPVARLVFLQNFLKDNIGAVMKEKYIVFKERQQAEFNDFPMAFAFSNIQFIEAMKKLGLTPEDTDKVVSMPSGGILRKTDAAKYGTMNRRHRTEFTEAMKDPAFAYEAFVYELQNHEYSYTYDVTDTLEALGITTEEIENNPVLKEALDRAKLVLC